MSSISHKLNLKVLLLVFIPPLIPITYSVVEYLGYVDEWSGRKLAAEGLNRLKSTAGFPHSWIYNKDKDVDVFRELERRISKNSKSPRLKALLESGRLPTLITTGGNAIEIKGIKPDWPQEERFVYLPNQPVLYAFEASDGVEGQTIVKAATLLEIEKWLHTEKENRDFWVAVIALGFVSLIFLVLQHLNDS